MIDLKLNNLIESARQAEPQASQEQHLRAVEKAILRSVDVCGKQTGQEQTILLSVFIKIDELMEKLVGDRSFLTNERLLNAYAKLSAIEPDVFWEKGLPKLRSLRKDLWSACA